MRKNSSDILERFRRGRGKDIDLTLRESYLDLLKKLGDPHLKLPPVLHVAGTNGKGSVCAFARAAIEAAGYRAHVYTSPHLVRFHERIRVAGKLIEEEELREILEECERLSAPGSVTFFEAASAAAFVAFARHPADAAIIEVGLGGRLDATNAIERPAATVITRLSFDHREYLGPTLPEIAREKAGILRPHVPCYIGLTPPRKESERRKDDRAESRRIDPNILEPIKQIAKDLDSPLFIALKDWRIEPLDEARFRYIGKDKELILPVPALAGRHQLWNAGLAIAALESLPLDIPEEALNLAMRHVDWPARLQRIESGELAALLPPGCELWLDGGHNDSAGEVLADQIVAWRKQDGAAPKPLLVTLGMLSTKVPREFLGPFARFIERMATVTIDKEPLALAAATLSGLAREAGVRNAVPAANLREALEILSLRNAPPSRILICGSLYLAGQFLRENSPPLKD